MVPLKSPLYLGPPVLTTQNNHQIETNKKNAQKNGERELNLRPFTSQIETNMNKCREKTANNI